MERNSFQNFLVWSELFSNSKNNQNNQELLFPAGCLLVRAQGKPRDTASFDGIKSSLNFIRYESW